MKSIVVFLLVSTSCCGALRPPSGATRFSNRVSSSDSWLSLYAQRPLFTPFDGIVESFKPIIEPLQFLTEKDVRVKYISSMLLRFSYFLGQGVTLSLTGFDKTGSQNSKIDTSAVVGALRDALMSESIDELAKPITPDMGSGMTELEIQRDLFSRNFAAIGNLLKKELNHIEDGDYKYPYDLNPTDKFSSNQWNPLNVLSQLNNYITDRRLVLDRRDRDDGQEIRKNFKGPKYPDYYLQNFHFQTDGWLSSRSAEIYDYQVESLFLGTADTMRRQVLPAITRFMRGKVPEDVKILDVATGTGRFASFVIDNFRGLDMTVMDLSPFYLENAKRLLSRFETVNYVEGAAEDIPFADDTFDAVTCVYLFHELPMEIRVKALQEFNRVLKPGGQLFFVDSAQSGEVPYERILKGFTIAAHEPYYLDYTKMDFPAALASAGFEVKETGVHWVTKTIHAVKIAEPHQASSVSVSAISASVSAEGKRRPLY